jgi:hypothetical protein
VLLAALCQNVVAQEEFPFSEMILQGESGFRVGGNFEYFFFKHGFFPGVRSDEEAAIIAEWKSQHPNAKVVPVSIFGEKAKFPIVYFWAVDGEENLNLFLIKKGVYPALVMLDTEQFNQILLLSKNFPYGKVLKAQDRAGNPTGVPSRRLVSDPRYEDFLKKLVAAETEAQVGLNGIWSDKFKQEREKMGITPLSTMPLSISHTDRE